MVGWHHRLSVMNLSRLQETEEPHVLQSVGLPGVGHD